MIMMDVTDGKGMPIRLDELRDRAGHQPRDGQLELKNYLPPTKQSGEHTTHEMTSLHK